MDNATNGHAANGQAAQQQEPESADTSAQPADEPMTWDREQAMQGMDYGSHPAGDLLTTLSRSHAPEDAKRLWQSELNQDHILGKLDADELWYRRKELDINMDLILASAPPPESIWQGPRRKAVGLDGKPWPFTPTEIHQARDTRDAAYARVSRSRDGWQQTLLAEQQTERRIVDESNDDSGGIFSKLVG